MKRYALIAIFATVTAHAADTPQEEAPAVDSQARIEQRQAEQEAEIKRLKAQQRNLEIDMMLQRQRAARDRAFADEDRANERYLHRRRW